MRIAQMIHFFRLGGLEQLAFRLADIHRQWGHDTHVIAYEDGDFLEIFRDKGIRTHVLPRPDRYGCRFSAQLARFFLKEGFDVIHTHHFGPLLYGAPAAYLSQIPLVHTTHSNEHLAPSSASSLLFKRLRPQKWPSFLRSFMPSSLTSLEDSSASKITSYVHGYRWLAPLCHRIATVSTELERFLCDELALSASKVRAIPNGVDSNLFDGSHNAVDVKSNVGIPDDMPLALTVARLEEEKGHRYLLDALALMEAPLRLGIIGSGSLEDTLKEQAKALGIEEKVHFLGTRHDLPELLSAADLFVLPSLREGLPLAMLEAMASGVPVVASAVGGVGSLLEESQAGLALPAANVDALNEALSELLAHPEKQRQMGEAGKQWVKKYYSFTKMAEEYLSLYQESVQAYKNQSKPSLPSPLHKILPTLVNKIPF